VLLPDLRSDVDHHLVDDLDRPDADSVGVEQGMDAAVKDDAAIRV
jgi:hypothetical protein